MLAPFLEVSFFFLQKAHLQVPEQFHILLRRVPCNLSRVLGRVTVQFVFRCFGFVISFVFFLAYVRSADSWMGARIRSTESGVLSEIVMLVFPLFARFLLFSARICLATLCFSISSCRDDVARVAGLALQGRCKVVVRVCVCVVSLWCCFMSSVVSSLWLPLVK